MGATVTAMSCARATDLAAEYVLGALDDVDADDVRRHLAACGEPHAEFAELGGVVPYLATSLDPVEPAPELRVHILGAIAGSLTVPAPRDAARPARTVDPVPAVARSRRRWQWTVPAMLRLGLVAAVAAAVVLAVSLVSLNARLSESQAYADRLAHAAALASVPGARTAALVSGDAGTGVGGLAVLPSGAAGVLVISGLAPTQGSRSTRPG
jgi:anti-sigma factor RsiW